MSEELKPCPFCREEPQEIKPRNPASELRWYVCPNGHTGIEMLIDNWNTRPLEDALTAECDALKAKLEMAKEALKYYYDNAEVGVGLGGDIAFQALQKLGD